MNSPRRTSDSQASFESSVMNRRTLLGAALGVGSTALLAACGSQSRGASSSPSASSAASSSTASSPSAASASASGIPSPTGAASSTTPSPTASASASVSASTSGPATIAPAQPSVESQPDSLRCLVNKMRPFAQLDWEPSDLVDFYGQQLRAEAAKAADTMIDAAAAAPHMNDTR